MRRIALACGLGVTLATAGCSGGGGGEPKPIRNGSDSNNRAPRISGISPPAVLADENYDFRPVASDPDGDILVFSISNKPPWARFDEQTGRLTGTPTESEVGLYTGITIVASDGRARATLPSFNVTVTQSAPGAVVLSWYPPTENEDGTVLQDLAGYRIYVGKDPDKLHRVIVVHNPGLTAYVVEHLSPSTWYFSMTSFNQSHRESERSAIVGTEVG
jgi:hypothetical protein